MLFRSYAGSDPSAAIEVLAEVEEVESEELPQPANTRVTTAAVVRAVKRRTSFSFG